MIFNEYQTEIRNYADYPKELGPFWLSMDMQTILGNISDQLKKSILTEGKFTEKNIINIKRMLGFLLNDIANMGLDIGIKLEDIAQDNLNLLELMKHGNKKED